MSSNTSELQLLKMDPATDGAQNFNIKTMISDNLDKIDARAVLERTHRTATNNPHGTTASQVGAYSKTESDANYAPKSHVGTGGAAHAAASQTAAGFMSTADKSKLDGIAANAEVNQNTFANVKVGATTIAADTKTDVLELEAGTSITLTPDATNDKVTIAVNAGDFAPALHVGAGGTAHPDATTTTAGFMSTTDKNKLDGIQANANNYVHPTGDGNQHVPATGSTSNKKVLKAGATADSAAWGNVDFSELTGKPTSLSGYGITDAAPINLAQMVKLTDDDGYIKNLGIVDLNTVTDIWAIVASTSANVPTTGYTWYLNTISESVNGKIQFAFTNSTNQRIFWRRYAQSVGWGKWDEIQTDAAPTWTNIALQNGALPYAAGVEPKFCKVGNVVHIKGAIKNINSFPTTIGILPAGIRPIGSSHPFSQTSSLDAGNVATTARWQIGTDGQIILDGKSGSATVAATWFPLNTSFIVG